MKRTICLLLLLFGLSLFMMADEAQIASGTVTLEDGFNVEKGATFAVYPSCF